MVPTRLYSLLPLSRHHVSPTIRIHSPLGQGSQIPDIHQCENVGPRSRYTRTIWCFSLQLELWIWLCYTLASFRLLRWPSNLKNQSWMQQYLLMGSTPFGYIFYSTELQQSTHCVLCHGVNLDHRGDSRLQESSLLRASERILASSFRLPIFLEYQNEYF